MPNRSPESAEARLKLRCQQQSGVFTMACAKECGIGPDVVLRRCRQGVYVREARGIYRDAAVPVSQRSRRFVALLAVGRDAVLARETAGDVFGLSSTPVCGDVHLVVKCSCPHRRVGIIVHRSLTLGQGHRTLHDGYPVTTPARTLCDLASVAGPVRMRRLVAEAVRRRLTSASQIRHTMAAMGRFRGKVALQAVLSELSPLEVVTRSALESEFLALMTNAGLPPTAMNHPVVDATGRRRFIDAVYLPPGLPIELDSRLAHGSLLDWHDDQRRENDIVLTGWLPFLRYNFFDVTRHGHLVVDQIKGVLARVA